MKFLAVFTLVAAAIQVSAFSRSASPRVESLARRQVLSGPLGSTASVFQGEPKKGGIRIARDLILSLVEEEQCFTTETGARSFGDVCSINIVYEDCYEPQPIVGKTVSYLVQYMLDPSALFLAYTSCDPHD
jgi:hypothetical protein